MRKSFPIHPLLLLVFFFLHLWAYNIERFFQPEKLLIPFAICLGATLLTGGLLFIFYRSFDRAVWVLSLLLFAFFGYGHLFNIFLGGLHIHPRIISGVYLAFFIAIPFFLHPALPWAGWFNKKWKHVYANIFAGVLVLIPLAKILAFTIFPYNPPQTVRMIPFKFSKYPQPMPDVYYIILDEYGRADVLKQTFNLDNTLFLNFLRQRGFFVAEQSTSNYTITMYSLASSLNMRYLKVGEENAMFENIQNNLVATSFKKLGYKFVFMNSGVTYTETNPLADYVISYLGVDETQLLLVSSTLLRGYSSFFLGQSWRNRHLHNFEELGKVPQLPGPKFTFAHFVIPHPPFVFKSDGSPQFNLGMNFSPNRNFTQYMTKYPEQLLYLNQLVEKVTDQILKKSKNPPVIIIQSDHGVDPISEDWHLPENYRKRIANLLAVYAPEPLASKCYDGITPVNIFRVFFREVFGANLDLLPDKNYLSREFSPDQEQGIDDWYDMTPIVKKASVPLQDTAKTG